MSMSIVLLNKDGVIERKLQFVTLPDDYVVPEGMTVSWRTRIVASSDNVFAAVRVPKEPVEAYFKLGKARGRICCGQFEMSNYDFGPPRYGVRHLVITVQGTDAKDVMQLRERILSLIHSGATWGVSNDLNPPKPGIGFGGRLRQLFGGQQPAA